MAPYQANDTESSAHHEPGHRLGYSRNASIGHCTLNAGLTDRISDRRGLETKRRIDDLVGKRLGSTRNHDPWKSSKSRGRIVRAK